MKTKKNSTLYTDNSVKELFTIHYNDEKIFGVYSSAINSNAIVILCYGMNGNRSCQHRLAIKLESELARNNMDMVRFDYWGVGLSESFFEKSTIESRVESLEAIISYVQQKKKGFPIILLGFSDGARIAVLSTLHNKINGIILWNAIFTMENGNRILNYSNDFKLKMHTLYHIPVKELLGVGLNLQTLKEMRRRDIIEIYESLSCSKFAIFGTEDEMSKETQKYFTSDSHNSAVLYIPGADHLFNRNLWEQRLICQTINYLNNMFIN